MVIVVPFLLPLITRLSLDLTWCGILIAVTLQMAWLSPLVALSADLLKGVAPAWDLKDIYGGMMQFMVLPMLAVFLITIFPAIALWLPRAMYGTK